MVRLIYLVCFYKCLCPLVTLSFSFGKKWGYFSLEHLPLHCILHKQTQINTGVSQSKFKYSVVQCVGGCTLDWFKSFPMDWSERIAIGDHL